MSRRRRRHANRRALERLVRARIRILYEAALEAARRGDLDYSARLGGLIRELSTYTRVRIPRDVKKGLCKHCSAPLIPGLTARVRLVSQGGFSYKVIRCLRCGWIHRYPYKKRREPRSELGRGKEEGQAGAP